MCLGRRRDDLIGHLRLAFGMAFQTVTHLVLMVKISHETCFGSENFAVASWAGN
jgi:hypothetical protein